MFLMSDISGVSDQIVTFTDKNDLFNITHHYYDCLGANLFALCDYQLRKRISHCDLYSRLVSAGDNLVVDIL